MQLQPAEVLLPSPAVRATPSLALSSASEGAITYARLAARPASTRSPAARVAAGIFAHGLPTLRAWSTSNQSRSSHTFGTTAATAVASA
jgi:hypothetical protein